jgi:hypothetical protein
LFKPKGKGKAQPKKSYSAAPPPMFQYLQP